MTDETAGPAASASFSAASSREILRIACTIAGLDDNGAVLMRLGENALFHLPGAGIVVRIARAMDYWPDVAKEVQVARWLAGNAFPAVQLYNVPQPIAANGHPVTFWRFVEGRPGDRQDMRTLGAILRRVHTLPSPTNFALPSKNIFARARPRISVARVPETDKDFLLRRVVELQSEVHHLRYPLDPAPTHGDSHVENLIVHDGEAVLIDLERFAWGQPEWDLAVTATEYLTAKWFTDSEYSQFVSGYGYDVMSWAEGFDILRAVQELMMTTWLMQNVDESAEIADEYHVRMRTLRGEPSPDWRPF